MFNIIKRVAAMFLSIALIISLVPIGVNRANASGQEMNKILYRHREKIKRTTSVPLDSSWILESQTSSKQLLQKYNKLAPDEVTSYEKSYSADYYYLSKVKDGSVVKYTTQPYSGTAYYFDKALPDYGMYDENQRTYSLHPTTGIKLYLRGVYDTYTLSVYTRYLYKYWKWSEWSAWSETPVEANEDIEVETKSIYMFSISYNANGGVGAPEPITKEFDETIILSSIIPTRENYLFLGWSTTFEGNVEYLPGEEYSVNASVTFYAVWKNITQYTVLYDTDGGDGTFESQEKSHDVDLSLHTETPTKNGYTFSGWKADDGTLYSAGDTYSANESTTLTAQWKANTYTITFDANGGTGEPDKQTKTYGNDIVLSSNTPTRDGYIFEGWSTEANGDVEYLPGATYQIDKDTILYAVWRQVPETTIIASGTCGDDLTWTLYDDGSFLINGTGAMYDWYTTQSTKMPWFAYKKQIKSIKIEEGATTVGNYTFADCTNLTEIVLPSTLVSINEYAFQGANITKLTIPDNVESIGQNAFKQCRNLTTLNLGENIKTIGNYAFYACNSLRSIKLNSKLKAIGAYAFISCELVETIEIQENLKSIGTGAFAYCDKLKEFIVHPDNPYFENDSNGVLYDSVNHILVQYPLDNRAVSYVLDNSTVEIALSAFSGCNYLNEVFLPKSLLVINEYNFDDLFGNEKPSTLYYAGTSTEWVYNVTIKERNGYTSDVLFNNGASEYRVSYNNNGSNYIESIPSQIKIHDVDLALTTKIFTRSGHEFKGWSTTKDGQVEYLPGDIYTKNADVTFYAVWVENGKYTISYDVNGGMGSFENQTKVHNADLTLYSKVPTKVGHVFAGWKAADGTVYNSGEIYKENEETILVAQWKPETYTLTLDPNGGELVFSATKTVTYGSAYQLTTSIHKEGYEFLGWYTSIDGGVQISNGTVVTETSDHTLYAHWEPLIYTISYDANGGTGAPEPQTKGYNVDIKLSSVIPVREGYTFVRWLLEEWWGTVGCYPGTTLDINYDTVLIAEWIITTYEITYNANGGNNAPESQTKTYGVDMTISSAIPARDGYTFKGWSTTPDGNVEYAPGATYSNDNDVTLYAVWEKKAEYTISYDINGGNGSFANQTKGHDVDLTLPSEIPTKTGHVFAGWKATDGTVYDAGTKYKKNESTVLTARWFAETYEIEFDANGGTNAPSPISATYGIPVQLDSTPKRDGYIFVGWATSVDDDAEYPINSTYSATENVTLYAIWEPMSYDITYDLNGGYGEISNQSKIADEDLILPSEIPTKTGYVFVGWKAMDGTVYEPEETYTANKSTIFTAQWEVITYAISYSANGGINAPAVQTKTYGVDLILSTEIPVYDGYIFKGWSTNASGNVEYFSGATYSGNVDTTLYAVWEEDSVMATGTCGENLTWVLDKNGTLKINGSGEMEDYTLSSYTPWMSWANFGIKSIVIEPGVTNIGANAFSCCTNLVDVTIPDSVTDIGEGAFWLCKILENIKIPSNVTSIGDNAFRGCEKLKSFVVPSGVTTLESGVFSYCSELSSITLPKSVSKIEQYALLDCSMLSEIYYDGTAVDWSKIDVEVNNQDLAGMVMHFIYTVSYDANGGFNAPVSQTKVHNSDIIISNNIPIREDYTFKGWSSVKNGIVEYLPGETYLGLNDITLYAVWEAEVLDDIRCSGTLRDNKNIRWTLDRAGVLTFNGTGEITYFPGEDWDYEPFDYTDVVSVIINEGITDYGYGLYEYENLESIYFPGSIKTISRIENRNVKNVTIGEGVENIGMDAFSGCRYLSEVSLPNTVTSIGDFAFQGCVALSNIEFPEGLSSIGDYAFSGSSITSVVIPSSIVEIGVEAFGYITIKSIYISDLSAWCNGDMGTIIEGADLYLNGKLVTDLVIPEDVTEIKHYAFYGCTSIKNVVIPDSVSSFGIEPFGCVTVYGKKGTAAEILTEEWGLPFEEISISIDRENLELNRNSTSNLSATVNLPESMRNIIWESSDNSVATVENGVVTAVGEGNAIITATSEDGSSASCSVTVTASAPKIEYSFGQSVQIGLIEPWFLKANLLVYTDSMSKPIDYNTLKDYGAYFIRKSELSDTSLTQSTIRNEDILNNPNAVKKSKLSGTAGIDGSLLTANYDKGLYTYEMGDSVFVLFYVEDEAGIQYAPIRERNIKTLLDERKNNTQSYTNVLERNVYDKMSILEGNVKKYRAQFDEVTKLPDMSAPVLSKHVSQNGAFTDETVKTYTFGNSVQLVLVEPWGLKVNAIVQKNGKLIDYNSVEEYGAIVFYDTAGEIAGGKMSAEELRAKSDAYVFSSKVGDATIDGSLITALYNKGIYTYQLNSNAYVMFYVKDADGYHYGDVKVRNAYELAKTRGADTSGSYGEQEKIVYQDMVTMYETVKAYRDDYFGKN